jgi:hypothetical protein
MNADAAGSEAGRAFRRGPGEDVLLTGKKTRHGESIKGRFNFSDIAARFAAQK